MKTVKYALLAVLGLFAIAPVLAVLCLCLLGGIIRGAWDREWKEEFVENIKIFSCLLKKTGKDIKAMTEDDLEKLLLEFGDAE